MKTENSNTHKKIRIIPAVKNELEEGIARLSKECGYIRVSTKELEQLYSYETQKEYYDKLLGSDPNIDFVGLYADRAKSGASMKKRKEFMRMIGDCYDGKIDRIRTKSVSRFARNTSECLEMVKKLREIGVYVNFETLNIDTKDETAMMILTVAAAIAEEELRNIVANIDWAVKNTFKRGKAWGNASVYGLKANNAKELEQTEFEIIPDEAIIVQKIFRDYLAGNSIANIAGALTERGVPTPRKKEQWQETTIKSILENEKYCGDLMLQKTYKPDLLSTRRKNDDKRDKVEIVGNHLPIVDKSIWHQVQIEMAHRERTNNVDGGAGRYSSKYVFSTRVECSECGTKYRRHAQWYKEDRIPTWVCSKHQKEKDVCAALPIKEADIEKTFVAALEKAAINKHDYIAKVKADIEAVIQGTSHLSVDTLQEKLEKAQQDLLTLNAKYKGNGKRITQEAVTEANRLMDEITQNKAQIKMCKDAEDEKSLLDYRLRMLDTALTMSFTKFNEDLFKALVDKIVVLDKNKLRFIFKSGIEIEQAVAA